MRLPLSPIVPLNQVLNDKDIRVPVHVFGLGITRCGKVDGNIASRFFFTGMFHSSVVHFVLLGLNLKLPNKVVYGFINESVSSSHVSI